MLSETDFKKWIEASHDIFEIFEGRYDAYPLSKRWVDEWFSRGKFTIEPHDIQRLKNLIDSLDFKAFGIKDPENIKAQLIELLEELPKQNNNIGFAVSFYLITWNMQRFKEYFNRRKSFSLLEYFEYIGKRLEELKDLIQFFRDKSLLSDDIYEKDVRGIFNRVNEILKDAGIKNNEPVGTIKLLHILAPRYFPLIDNSIAEQILYNIKKKHCSKKKKRSVIDINLYIKWMHKLKNWLKKEEYETIIKELEDKHKYSILKLVDEGLYIMCSINLQIRTSKLGI